MEGFAGRPSGGVHMHFVLGGRGEWGGECD